MKARIFSKLLRPELLSTLMAASGLLLAGAATQAAAQTSAPKAASQVVPVEPCRMLLGGHGITLITASGAKCQAGAPLNLSAMHVDDYMQRLCDFTKSIVKTKAESMQDVDSVQCLFNGKPLPGPIGFSYGRVVDGKVVEITD